MDSAIIELIKQYIYHDLGVKHFRGKINLKLSLSGCLGICLSFSVKKGEM